METSAPNGVTGRIRRTVRLAAILNLAYFGVEVAVALVFPEPKRLRSLLAIVLLTFF
jgi:hypothetical protein